MPTHAAFLRAINLGRSRKASGADLRRCFDGAGFDEVATFRNSGNVVFSGVGTSSALGRRIEAALTDGLGFEVSVYLRTAAQLRRIAAQQPFPVKVIRNPKGKLQVALLPKKPEAKRVKEVLGLASDEDRLAIEGTELYWLPSGGTQRSDLDLNSINEAIGPYTMRTMGTIESLVAKFFG